jgi:hypothetical protein
MLFPSIFDSIMSTTTIALVRLTRLVLSQPSSYDLAAIVTTFRAHKDQVSEFGDVITGDEKARLGTSLDILAQSSDDVLGLLTSKNLAQRAAVERNASAESGPIALVRELCGLAREIEQLLQIEPSKS